MPIRCHAEHDGAGILLYGIEASENAESLRSFFVQKGIAATIQEPGGEHDHRVYLPGINIGAFAILLAEADIDLN